MTTSPEPTAARFKAATRNWNEVWVPFDNRKQAKLSVVANEDSGEGDMFSRAGGAAE